MEKKGVGLYCAVCSQELAIALITLTHAAKSEYVKYIVIVLTDSLFSTESRLAEKIILYGRNFGKGFEEDFNNGGYDQISARNFALDCLYKQGGIDWVMQHDADDLYMAGLYEFAVKNTEKYEALTCSCFSLKNIDTVGASPMKKYIFQDDKILFDPHTRIWKKSLGLVFEKSQEIEQRFLNHSRHCGVSFPSFVRYGVTVQPWHFHLHALLKKRHTEIIAEYPSINVDIPIELKIFFNENRLTII